jgi:hypothetical protein
MENEALKRLFCENDIGFAEGSELSNTEGDNFLEG